jgi:hypothetical protein
MSPRVASESPRINGLDPEGILWIRTLMRSLASEGRTVFLSSHLMSEMTLSADHLTVIGRGRIIADAGTAEFINGHTAPSVRVRAAEQTDLSMVSSGSRALLRVARLLCGRRAGSRVSPLEIGLERGELIIDQTCLAFEFGVVEHGRLEEGDYELRAGPVGDDPGWDRPAGLGVFEVMVEQAGAGVGSDA